MDDMISIAAEEYEQLCANLVKLEALRALIRDKATLASWQQDLIPAALANRLLCGENPLRVWREHRELTQFGLARLSQVSRVQIVQIEGGRRTGSVATMKKLAIALDVSVDDLI